MKPTRPLPARMPRSATLGSTLAVVLAAGLGVGGCRLVDQRTFSGTGLAPTRAQLGNADFAATALPPLPLVTVRFDNLDQDWRPGVLEAVRGVLAHRPDAQFDLVAPVPTGKSLDLQDRALNAGAADAQQVAEILLSDNIAADHIHLGSRGDPGQPPREVRVYVR